MFKKIGIIVTGLLLLSACSSKQVLPKDASHETIANVSGDDAAQTVMEGQKAPEMTVMDQNGKPVNLTDYAGKKVYLNFWASWCEPCLDEMPEIEKVYQKYKDNKDYAFLSVTSPSDAIFENSYPADEQQEKILKTAKKLGITYPILYDHKDSALMAYTIRAFPSHVFINSDGTVNKVFSGELTKDTLEAGLKALK